METHRPVAAFDRSHPVPDLPFEPGALAAELEAFATRTGRAWLAAPGPR